MNTTEIKYILKNTLPSKVQLIVCSANQLLNCELNKPSMFVVNTDQSEDPGSHWVSFYFPQHDVPEFFDSLGHPPEHYHKYFQSILITHGPCYVHNVTRIQAYNSCLCGEYCIYFLINRSEGFGYEKILCQFMENCLYRNDVKIMKYFNYV
jgi:hypothetical protein